MPNNCEGSISLTLRTRNSKKPLRMLARNWKRRWHLLCLARQARKASMGRPVAKPMSSNQNLRASWKPLNPQDCVWNILHWIIMRTNIIIWYTNLFLCLKPWRFPQQRQRWEKLEKIPAWDLTKVRSKSEVIDEARTKGAKVHFASLMDICHLKNAEFEAKHQKYKGRVVLRGDIVKDDSGSYAVLTEQGSSASLMTAANVMDVTSRLPGCAGQAADAVLAYSQVTIEDEPSLLKITKSECPGIWIRPPKHKLPKSWSSMDVRLFCWTGLVCVPDDCCNNNGCNCLTTRLWRTSSWCSICLYSGKIGGCSQIAQNSKARMSRFLDTSSTTQMAQIVVKHWRPSGSSWATFVQSSACWPLVGKTVRGGSVETWMGLGMSVCSSKTRIILVGFRRCHQDGKRHKMAPMWKKLMKLVDLLRSNIISWPRIFGMHSTWMQTERNFFCHVRKKVRFTNFCWINWKIARVGETSRKNCRVVIRCGRTCEKARLKNFRPGEQKDRTYKVSTPRLGNHICNLERFYWNLDWKKVPHWECWFVHRKQGLFLSVYVDVMSWPCILGMYSTWMQFERKYSWGIQKMFESRISAAATEKSPGWEKSHEKTVAWSSDMEGHAKNCVERYCELANK